MHCMFILSHNVVLKQIQKLRLCNMTDALIWSGQDETVVTCWIVIVLTSVVKTEHIKRALALLL